MKQVLEKLISDANTILPFLNMDMLWKPPFFPPCVRKLN